MGPRESWASHVKNKLLLDIKCAGIRGSVTTKCLERIQSTRLKRMLLQHSGLEARMTLIASDQPWLLVISPIEVGLHFWVIRSAKSL